MYCLAAETGEIVFSPVKYPHTRDGFHQVLKRLDGISHKDITVIMESTSTYHLKVERFFRENTACEIVILNPMISKGHKRNLRKTKTDKEDCLNLIDIFFKDEYNFQVQHDGIYVEMQFLSRRLSICKRVPRGHGTVLSNSSPCSILRVLRRFGMISCILRQVFALLQPGRIVICLPPPQ